MTSRFERPRTFPVPTKNNQKKLKAYQEFFSVPHTHSSVIVLIIIGTLSFYKTFTNWRFS